MASTCFIKVFIIFFFILSQKQIQRNSTADLEIKCFMQGWVVIHLTEWCKLRYFNVFLNTYPLTFSHQELMSVHFACCNLKCTCTISGNVTHRCLSESAQSTVVLQCLAGERNDTPLDIILLMSCSPCFWLTGFSTNCSASFRVWAAR